MPHYKLKPNAVKELKKKLFVRLLRFFFINLIFAVLLVTQSNEYASSAWEILPFLIPILTITTLISWYIGFKRQKKILESYVLHIGTNIIERTQLNTPTISIYFNEIASIERYDNGSFLVQGSTPQDQIAVSHYLEDYELVAEELNNLHLIIPTVKLSFLRKYQSVTSFIVASLMLVVYTTANKILVLSCGSALVALLIWSFIEIRKSKNIDEKTRRSSWWLILVLITIISGILTKLFGPFVW